jgi:hypothetical protein
MARNPHPSKSARRTECRAKGKHREETGIDNALAPFFRGGEDMIAKFMHYKPPRWTEEYAKMSVVDLVRRIQDDLAELQARAFPNYYAEWAQKFALNYWRQFPITYEERLLSVIHESIADSLCPGLMQRIRSPSESESKRALAEYRRLVVQLLVQEPKSAANALAFIAKRTTTYLENLSVKRGALMREIAAEFDLWPVNLGLKDKIVKGETRRELTRSSFARDYLIELGLNLNCKVPSGHESGAEDVSPFRLAAEDLYAKMLMLKRDWFPKVTPWAKRLFALAVPMTKSNAADWWQVAKIYLYERWDKAQAEFKPLIKHLRFKYPIELDGKKVPYPSVVKSRVIDNDLKDAFIGLAKPDL